MAHEIETAFFTSKPAWHGLGTVLKDPPSIEEAMIAAGLTWKVVEQPVFVERQSETGGMGYSPVLTHKAIVRETDKSVLGVVGKDWTPVQNVDAFKFFDAVLEQKLVTLEAAGSLRGGRRIWILAKIIGGTRDVGRGDPVEAYLLLYQGHDGTLRVAVQFTATRVVCANTLQVAMNRASHGGEKVIKLRHTPNVAEGLRIVKSAINVSLQTFEFTLDQYRYLTEKNITSLGLERYVKEVLDVPDFNYSDKGKAKGKGSQVAQKIFEAFEDSPGCNLPTARGTMWGAYNAVTHYLTHTKGRDGSNRLDSNWFGASAALSRRALMLAINSGQSMQ